MTGRRAAVTATRDTPHELASWVAAYRQAVNGDPQLQARGDHYSCSFVLDMGPHAFLVRMHRAKAEEIVVDPAPLARHYHFKLAAPALTWLRMARPTPPPAHQGIFAAQARAGLRIEGDLLVLMQNLRCFVRQHELLRVTGIPAPVAEAARTEEAPR